MRGSKVWMAMTSAGDIALTLLCGSMRFSPIETELVRLGIAAVIARGRGFRAQR